MLERLLGEKKIHQLFIFLYAIVVIALPLNKPVLSISLVLITALTFLGHPWARFKEVLMNNKQFLWFSLFFVWVLLSLLWTTAIKNGIAAINLTLPFYLLMIAFTIHPLQSRKEMSWMMMFFVASVTISALVNTINYKMHTYPLNFDKRDISLFVSHIRLSLMIVMSIVFSVYLLLTKKNRWRYIFLFVILFLLYYTKMSGVVSGFIAIAVVSIGGLIYYIYRLIRNKNIFYFTFFSLSVCILLVAIYGFRKFTTPAPFKVLEHTAQGNPYHHNLVNINYENGTPVNLNVSYWELETEWAKRSKIDLYDHSPQGGIYLWNLIRYLASKGLNKDAVAILSLSDEEIKNIENGQNSILEGKNDLKTKFIKLKDEYTSVDFDPNGYTFLQRQHYWKAGLELFKNNLLIGVGVGDAGSSYQQYYEQHNSPLTLENRRRAHLQFLSIGVSFGIIGLGLFSMFLFQSFYSARKSIVGILIMSVIIVSFLNEDTLETMAGATLCAVVFGLFSRMNFQSPQQEDGLRDGNNEE